MCSHHPRLSIKPIPACPTTPEEYWTPSTVDLTPGTNSRAPGSRMHDAPPKPSRMTLAKKNRPLGPGLGMRMRWAMLGRPFHQRAVKAKIILCSLPRARLTVVPLYGYTSYTCSTIFFPKGPHYKNVRLKLKLKRHIPPDNRRLRNIDS